MKKGYKRLQKRLLNETYKHREQELLKNRYKAVADEAQEEAEKYKERFRKFGSNVETEETTGNVVCLKWEVEQIPYGTYGITCEPLKSESIPIVRKELLERIAQGLMDQNIVQFIDHTDSSPFGRCTYAVKLYVVPWEQMPHKRTVELRQQVEKCLDIPPVQR